MSCSLKRRYIYWNERVEGQQTTGPKVETTNSEIRSRIANSYTESLVAVGDNVYITHAAQNAYILTAALEVTQTYCNRKFSIQHPACLYIESLLFRTLEVPDENLGKQTSYSKVLRDLPHSSKKTLENYLK